MLSNFLRGSLLPQQHRCLSVAPTLLKGHSKWQNIKATKGKNDADKSKKISFFLEKIKQVVRSPGGFDIKLNRDLEKLQLEYRKQSLPLDTFNNALARIKNNPDVTVYYEFLGPSGSFFVVETETDNHNRTRSTINKHVNKIGNFRLTNDLRKRFDEKLVAVVNSLGEGGKELKLADVEEIGIELDCEEVEEVNDVDSEEPGLRFELTFNLQNLQKLEDDLKAKGLEVETVEKRLIPQHRVLLAAGDDALVEKFYAAMMNEVPEVKNVFNNIE